MDSPKRKQYGKARWQKLRARHLAANPLCCYCMDDGVTKAADVVDHITPHKGDPALMWNPANLQSLCYHCHNSTKQAQEVNGFSNAVGRDGQPSDPNHPWNRE